MTTTATLSPETRIAMEAIRDGADIGDPDIARQLRTLQQSNPGWLHITKLMGNYDPLGVLPYFGAILTEEGRRVLDA